eukprot:1219548-Pyramimonas_sp.AAC.1
MSVNFTEADRLRLRTCDREVKRARLRLDIERVEELLREAQQASDQGHTSTVWNITFRSALAIMVYGADVST